MALTVGNTDKFDNLNPLSSRGPRLGDYAIKPEITATGTDIASARADGTFLGPVVDEHYTSISGTSMAAPHVAGAAALLLQKNPETSHGQLKAALASTAVPNPSLTVYEQGVGRLHVARAVFTDVVPDKAVLNAGYFPYPNDDSNPVTHTVTYTNYGENEVSLNLSVGVADQDGAPAVPGAVYLDTDVLTVPAGGEAAVDVIIDVAALGYGMYGGYLTAADEDGGVLLRTAIGFHKESEKYDVTIVGTARDGRLAGGISLVDVMDVNDRNAFHEVDIPFVNGEATVRVSPGTYSFNSFIVTYDEPMLCIEEVTFVAEPEVEITGDTTVYLDARPATRLQVNTPDPSTTDLISIAYYRADVNGYSHRHSFNTDAVGDRVYTVPTGTVTKGEYEFYSFHVLTAPLITMETAFPPGLPLFPEYMIGSPLFDGEFEAGLVFAGLGQKEDFHGLDVEGKVVLMEMGALAFADKAENAAEAGAIGALIHNNQPGHFLGTVEGRGIIPTFSLTQAEGQVLRAFIDQGDVSLNISGIPVSPFMYDLVLPEPGGIQGELIYTVGENAPVAELKVDYHSDVADKELLMARHNWRPYSSSAFGLTRHFDGPLTRTEYVTAGDTQFQQSVYYALPMEAAHWEPVTTYEEGTFDTVSWWKQAVRPGFLEGSPWQSPLVNHRAGDLMELGIAETADGSGRHWGWAEFASDTFSFRYYRDGELVMTDSRAYGLYPMVPERAEYRLEMDWARHLDGWLTSTETNTAWTFTSEGSPDYEVLPLLIVDYDLPVDLMNRLTDAEIGFAVRHQKGAATSPVAGAELEISFDDGASWEPVDVGSSGGGSYSATLPVPEGDAEYVSFRVEAWDEDGNTIEQTIYRAAAWDVASGIELTVTEPEDGIYTNDDTITVAGTATDPDGGEVAVAVNGEEAEVAGDGSFEIRILLPEDDGPFDITIVATDEGGSTVTEIRSIVVDRTAPAITGILPDEDVELEWGDDLTVSFISESGLAASYVLLVGAGTGDDGLPGVAMVEVSEGLYEGTYTAPEGAAFSGAEIELYAMDKAGNITRVTAPGKVTVMPGEDEDPDPVGPPTVVIDEPVDGFLTNRDAVRVSGKATDDQEGQDIEQVTVNGREVAVGADGSFSTRVILWEGDNVISVTAVNTAGETATETVTVAADWTAPDLVNMEPSADVTLEWGDTYTFRFESEPGLTAAYQIVVGGTPGKWITRDIPVTGTPMTETAPGSGVYEAVYTAPAGVLLDNALVQINAADEAGNVIMVTTPGTITVTGD